MHPKTYDFRAFCRGELLRTNGTDVVGFLIRCFEAPVWDGANRPMRAIVLPGYPYYWYAYTESYVEAEAYSASENEHYTYAEVVTAKGPKSKAALESSTGVAAEVRT